MRRLKKEKYALFYSSLEDLSCLAMESLSDASFANLNDGGSQGGCDNSLLYFSLVSAY